MYSYKKTTLKKIDFFYNFTMRQLQLFLCVSILSNDPYLEIAMIIGQYSSDIPASRNVPINSQDTLSPTIFTVQLSKRILIMVRSNPTFLMVYLIIRSLLPANECRSLQLIMLYVDFHHIFSRCVILTSFKFFDSSQ